MGLRCHCRERATGTTNKKLVSDVAVGQANVGAEDEVPVNAVSSVVDCVDCDPEFVPISAKSWRPRSSGKGSTTYICERRDGSTCRRNYEQLKKVNAQFEENMSLPLEKPKKVIEDMDNREFLSLISVIMKSGNTLSL